MFQIKPPEEISQLMHFIARKSANVKSPIKITELCSQFREETGSKLSDDSLKRRIVSFRDIIHIYNEFDLDTTVKMMFALSASIASEFLIELRKVADVEVNDQQKIIKYKKKDGGMELCAKHMKLSINEGEQRDKSIIQFLIEKTKMVNTPMVDASFVKEFKNITGCLDSIKSLRINKNTKVKMMFISNANLSEDILEELRKDANVDVDEGGRITKYNADDGSLELGGDHSLFSRFETARAGIRRQRLETISSERKRARGVSVEDDDVEKSLKIEDDREMDFNTTNAEDFDHAPPSYELDKDHILGEKKPVDLIEVKLEELVEPSSTSNLVYHYEENLEHLLSEPKSEIVE